MKCEKCGSEVANKDVFCPECGSKIIHEKKPENEKGHEHLIKSIWKWICVVILFSISVICIVKISLIGWENIFNTDVFVYLLLAVVSFVLGLDKL